MNATATPPATQTADRRRKPGAQGTNERLAVWWQNLAPRERKAVTLASWLMGLALLWWVLLGPAVQTLRKAGDQHATLDAQIAQMQRMAASAQQLRGQNSAPTPSRGAAQSALAQATGSLGATGQVSVQGDRAILTLRGASPEALAQWLSQVRVNARLTPIDAQIDRRGNPAGWHGQITVAGPGLGSPTP
jgi:general secretion pathway protein M